MPSGHSITLQASISENTAATNEIVAAVTGKRIVVDSLVLVCTAANTLNWEDGTTDISGVMSFAANGGYTMSGGNLLSTSAGAALLTLAGTAQAQCENMRVIVRNSVYAINGLEAFCTEFNKLKADVAGMRSALDAAREENDRLRARLAASMGATQPETQARVALESGADATPK